MRARAQALMLGLCVLVGWLTLGVGSAAAQLTEVTTFGSAGSGANEFSSPAGVAADESDGSVYVVDAGNLRVEKFDSAGNFVLAFGQGVDQTSGGDVCTAASGDTCQAGTEGSAPGEFTAPDFVAVDNSTGPSAGDVYVADYGDDIVSKFDSSGDLVASWGTDGQLNGGSTFGPMSGIAVDSSGNLLVISGANQVYEFAQDGTAITNFPTVRGMSPDGLAVDSAGNLFKGNLDGSIEELTSSGGDIGQVTTSVPSTALALDPATGDLYVDLGNEVEQYVFDASGNVLEPGSPSCPVTPGSDCAPTETFGSPGIGNGQGLAFDPGVTFPGAGAPGALYVADRSNQNVAVFVPPAPAPPSVVEGSETASNVQPNSATLAASVNPDGLDTHYYFEYVDDAHYRPSAPDPYSAGTQLPLPPGNDIGSSFTAQPASVDISALEPGVTYHWRVVAQNKLNTTDGPDQTVATPFVITGGTQDVTDTSAMLTGRLDPQGVDVFYYFEYGPDSSYGSLSGAPVAVDEVGSGATDVVVDEQVTGLVPDTTYHYLLAVSADGGSTYAYAEDESFTTLPSPPSVVTGFASGTAPANVTLAGTVNPHGAPTTYHFEYGATSSYGASTSSATVGSGTAPVLVSRGIGDVVDATTYHFRVVATNAGGTSYGADQTFTTAANPLSAVRPIVRRGRLVLGVRGSVTNRAADVSASCRGAKGTTCAGRVVVSARERVSAIVHARRRWVVKTVAIGGARFKLVGGQMTVLRVKLSHGGARGLPAGGNHVVVTVVVTQAGRGKVTRRVTLERERER